MRCHNVQKHHDFLRPYFRAISVACDSTDEGDDAPDNKPTFIVVGEGPPVTGINEPIKEAGFTDADASELGTPVHGLSCNYE